MLLISIWRICTLCRKKHPRHFWL